MFVIIPCHSLEKRFLRYFIVFYIRKYIILRAKYNLATMTNLAQKSSRYPQLDNGSQTSISSRLQEIDNEIIDYETRITEKEKRCMELLDDSISLGVGTNAELYHQGAQLDKISNMLRHTEVDAQASAQTLTNMEWRQKHPFLSLFMSARQKTKAWFVPSTTPADELGQSVRGLHKSSSFHTDTKPGDKFADVVSNKVAVLKSLALDMNEELGTQNKKLDEINDHTDHVTVLVDSVKHRTGKFLSR
jgi:hypothetical protein